MKTIVYGSTIKGNGHYVSGRECQDSNSFSERDFSEDAVKVIALSDGHGGAPYYRSAQGSRFAVEIAKEALYRFVTQSRPLLDEIEAIQHVIDAFSAQFPAGMGDEKMSVRFHTEIAILRARLDLFTQRLAFDLEGVKKNIIDEWGKRVDEALASNPVCWINAQITKIDSAEREPSIESLCGYGSAASDQMQLINRDLGKGIAEALERNPRQIYGATLLAAAQYKDHTFILQLGDGDVTVIDGNGHAENPIKKSATQIGNETDSLCLKNALDKCRAVYFRRMLKLVMLTTDGVANALEDESALADIAMGVYTGIDEEPTEFRAELKPLLRRFSNGSTDDCTLCFIANGIKDESYEIIKAAKEVEEAHDLARTRVPLLTEYALNRDVYLPGEPTEGKKKTAEVKFTGAGMAAFQKSFLRDRYFELIDAETQLAPLSWQKRLLIEIFDFAKRHLKNQEKQLEADQVQAYRAELESFLRDNPIRLMRHKAYRLEMTPQGKPLVSEGEERYSVVLGMTEDRISFAGISPELYQSICKDPSGFVTFVGHMPLNGEYKLKINKFDIKLVKET